MTEAKDNLQQDNRTAGELGRIWVNVKGDKAQRLAARAELQRRGLPVPMAGRPQSKARWTSQPDRGTTTDPDQIAANFADIHNELVANGATLDNQSESGSRYYTMPDGSKVRVSDHAPNDATQQWIDRSDVEEIRADEKFRTQLLGKELTDDSNKTIEY